MDLLFPYICIFKTIAEDEDIDFFEVSINACLQKHAISLALTVC